MQDHIVKSFDVEIAQLKEAIMNMAKKCENQLEKSVQALKLMDIELAEKVVANDHDINALQQQIEERAVAFLAKRQPLAVDLRQLLCMMKIAAELERIGDYAANVARRITRLSHTPENTHQKLIIDMANIGRVMLHDVLLAFLMLDVDKAVEVWNKDDEIDTLFIQTITQIQQQMNAGNDDIEDGTQLIFMGKCFERIGDHITNIAEDIYYILSGKNFINEFDTE